MFQSLAGRHIAFDDVGAGDQPDAIVVGDGAEGDERGQFRRHGALGE